MKFSDIQNKKIACGLFGISYRSNYKHWMGWNTNIDWRKANTHTKLIPFMREHNDVDVFFSTYNNEMNESIISDFGPKSYIFNDFVCNNKNKTWVSDKHKRFKETVVLLDEHKDDYDYFVITRFDFNFNMNYFRNGKIDNECINVTAKWCVGDDCKFIDDCFPCINS